MNHLLLKQTILYSFQPLSPCIISYLFTDAHTCVQVFSTTPTRVCRVFNHTDASLRYLLPPPVKTCCIGDEVNDQLRAVIRYTVSIRYSGGNLKYNLKYTMYE